MKTKEGSLRHFAIAFGIALVLYFAAFHLIESCRIARKPWVLTFEHRRGTPAELLIEHENGPTRIRFAGAPAATNEVKQTIVFDKARPVPFGVPFGTCVFLDTTFLPGTVTLQCFGHEIEMIPRVLIIDHQEHAWKPGMLIALP